MTIKMTPEEIAKKEASEEWVRRLNKFSESIINLLYWDKEPLEQAIAYREKLQAENSRLRERIAELESQLTQRAGDLAVDCPFCGASAKDIETLKNALLAETPSA